MDLLMYVFGYALLFGLGVCALGAIIYLTLILSGLKDVRRRDDK